VPPLRTRPDIHDPYDFFEYVRTEDGSAPAGDEDRFIDVALLDMNHSWPNVGHDSLAHAVLEAAEHYRHELVAAELKLRLISYDVRRRHAIPEPPNGRFQLYVGTGGPGHLDPRQNDGAQPWSQGITETAEWEAPLFRLFDDILTSETASLLAICHSFGLMCRWSGAARPVQRDEKSSGMPTNVLTDEGLQHPWFAKFGRELGDNRHYRVIDNRLFDLVMESPAGGRAIGLESEDSRTLTMLELARDASGMPRIFGANHHPEIIDREHIMAVLEEKRAHGEVSDQWYEERAQTMRQLLDADSELQSRITSEFTLLGLLRHQVGRIVAERSK
jgi:hypothetical protein